MDNNIENLKNDMTNLVGMVKDTHNDLFLNSVKNKELRKYTIQVKGIMDALYKVLEALPNLKELDTNMYLCYENDIYLSFIKGRYVISRIKDNKVKVLSFTKNLQKALEIFYSQAYNTNKKHLRKYAKDNNDLDNDNLNNDN